MSTQRVKLYQLRWLVFACLLLPACAKVNPTKDIRRTSELITERTGSSAVYDPQADEQIAEHVAALLKDGLTIEEAISVALLNNHAFQSAFQEIGVSRANLVQSGLLTNPSLTFMDKLPEGGGLSHLELSFGQQISDLWQIPVRKEIAKAQLENTILDIANKAINLAADVRVHCHQLLAIQQAQRTIHDSLALIDQSVELAEARFKAGGSQLDVNLVRTGSLDIRLEAIAIEREERTAKIALARLLGLSDAPDSWQLVGELPAPKPIPDRLSLLTNAMRRRLDARLVEYQVKAAEATLKQEYLKIFPNVSVGLEMERPEARALPGRSIARDALHDSILAGKPTVPNIQTKAERDLERRQMIDFLLGPSLTVTLPIWDQNQAQIAQARYKAVQRRKDYEDVIDRVNSEVQSALVTAENAAALVKFYETEALPQARANLDASRRLYQGGQQTILVLIEFENSLILRERAYVRALGEYAVAITELERAVGGKWELAAQSQPASAPSAEGPKP